MKQYKIANGDNGRQLENDVNRLMHLGWEPQGGITVVMVNGNVRCKRKESV